MSSDLVIQSKQSRLEKLHLTQHLAAIMCSAACYNEHQSFQKSLNSSAASTCSYVSLKPRNKGCFTSVALDAKWQDIKAEMSVDEVLM